MQGLRQKFDNYPKTHLTREVNRVAGGYGLTGVALRTVDLVTGEATELTGKSAIRQAQKFQDEIPCRLHNIDPSAWSVKKKTG